MDYFPTAATTTATTATGITAATTMTKTVTPDATNIVSDRAGANADANAGTGTNGALSLPSGISMLVAPLEHAPILSRRCCEIGVGGRGGSL